MSDSDFQLYDTTLRDGAQQEGLVLSVGDKLSIARRLDAFGVTFIEGGWPGAIPKDTEFFRRAQTELTLRNAQLVAFGATRRPDTSAQADPQLAALLRAQTPLVTLVAKADSRHVDLVLRTTKAENLAMVRDSVRHLVREGRRVFLDAEHFFDGFRTDRRYALAVIDVAAEAGAEAVVLCDTNGGTLPEEIGSIMEIAADAALGGIRLGIHCHDDTGCAVANTLLAVDAGATHVQVTAHGYGERCGNANLFTVAANLALKRGLPVVSAQGLAALSEVADTIAGITAVTAPRSAPYVGAAAFTHKAGLHTSAVRVDPSLYQHIEPERVGNTMRTLVSDMAGRAAIELKARELGYDLAAGSEIVGRVAARVKELEHEGYTFESATASFELLVLEELSEGARPFEVDSWKVVLSSDRVVTAQATVKVGDGVHSAEASHSSAIEALCAALRQALSEPHPVVKGWHLAEYRATSLDGSLGKPSATRVLVTLTDGEKRCHTVGVDEDNLTASWRALQDAVTFILLCDKRSVVAAV
ncbi:MAG TPA: citramalate synthase [Candidatus Limnocylindrales bacterium]|nr:citramalate synthase [Candidatus Limnocylindrales bacterium]